MRHPGRVSFVVAAMTVADGGCQTLLVFPDDGKDAGAASLDATVDAVRGDAATCDVDVRSDSRHCGRCGHDCLGGQCTEGVCKPMPFATGLTMPWYLAGDDDALYVTSQGASASVTRIDKTTRAVVPLALGESDPFAIGIAGDDVVWGSSSKPGFRAAPRRADGPARDYGNVTLQILEFAVTPRAVYFTSVIGSAAEPSFWLGRKSRDGTTVTAVATGSAPSEGIVADSDYVYFARPSGSILRAPVRITDTIDEPAVFVTTKANGPRRLVMDADYVYWVSYESGFGRAHKTRADLVEERGVAAPNRVGGLAVDASYFYFVNTGSGTVFRVPLGEKFGQPETVASGYSLPVDIHQDVTVRAWT